RRYHEGFGGMERAVILCDGYFGQNTGKTANGLVRYSKRYTIVGVIDHTKAGRDAGEVLDGKANGIPIVADLKEAIERGEPDTLIVGVATFGGYIPQEYRPILREAIEQTGLIQGSTYGVPLDAIKGDFMVGELESDIVRAYEETKPKAIIVEGQGSISHPAYVCGTRAIINAAMPSGIVMMHAPARK